MRVAPILTALACLGILGIGPLAGQSLRERPNQGFLDDDAVYSLADVNARCLTPLVVNTVAEVREPECRVVEVRELEGHVDDRWFSALYRRSALVDWTEPADSVEWDEVVLLRARAEDASMVPVWHIRTERIIEVLQDVKAQARTEGLLIEVLICLNGTGGCSREYLLDSRSELRYVDKVFADELKAMLTGGQHLHGGMRLDLQTLRGMWPVAVPGDGNCCPSLMFDYAVRLDGVRLMLVEATLRPVR